MKEFNIGYTLQTSTSGNTITIEKINFDYLSNNMIKSFPHGLDFEIVSLEALKKSMILLCRSQVQFINKHPQN